ncbi:two-component system sensor histidine kinase NtrB [Cohnella soli]|uniref:histidine kinase n=1 Tax=Cohnella soli TaxID=425005 RepID=A0ABW0HQK6_9BACL
MDDRASIIGGIRSDRESLSREAFVERFSYRFLEMENIGVLLLDADFCIVEISVMICELFGGKRESYIGMPADQWMRSVGMQAEPFGRELLYGAAFRDRALHWAGGKTNRRLMLDGETLLRDGEPIGAFVLFRDVSQVLELEEQVRRSDRLKMIGQIAAGTAHEIRNPLTAIIGFMQLLNKALSDREMDKERRYVGIVLAELDRVNGLVSEFLLLSKQKESKLVLLRVEHVLKEIMPMIRNEALLHGVTVVYRAKSGAPPVMADKELLKQVFLNLGKNAIEAMGEGGTLTIRECHSPHDLGKICVEFDDTGPGIPVDVLEKMFDPFFTTKAQGTGLGLSVCQRIVDDLGGGIAVATSTEGTRFTVWLPAPDGGAQSPYDV